jgi:cobyrinic acid a,c-diamide synthase
MVDAVRIFVAGDRSQVGKSSVCLGLLGSLLSKGYDPSSIAYIKPATQCEKPQLLWKFCASQGIACEGVGPIVYYPGFTRAFLNGETESREEFIRKTVAAVDKIAAGKRLVVIDGVGYPAVGSICGLSNADVALATGASVVYVGKKGVGDAVDSYNLCTAYFAQFNVPVLGALFNRLPADGYYSLENCKSAITNYFEQKGLQAFGFLPELEQLKLGLQDNDSDNAASMSLWIDLFQKHVDVDGILAAAGIGSKSDDDMECSSTGAEFQRYDANSWFDVLQSRRSSDNSASVGATHKRKNVLGVAAGSQSKRSRAFLESQAMKTGAKGG